MTLNKDGSERKKRVNAPTNHIWTKAEAVIAFFCYKGEVSVETKNEVAKKFNVSISQLNARINEFQIYTTKRIKTDKVSQMTIDVFNEYSFKKIDECSRSVDLFLYQSLSPSDETISELDEESTAVSVSIDDIVQNSELIKIVQTKNIIDQIIDSGIVSYNSEYICADNLKILENVESLDYIASGLEGCYFIFSNIPINEIPVFSTGGVKSYQNNNLVKDGITFRCLYNGKGNSVKERLKVHLFNSHTLKKISGTNKTTSGTGAMSLVSLPESKFIELQKLGQYMPEKHKLKPVRKSIQPESFDQRENDAYFLNGIDITEEPWNKYKFAVLVLKSDSELGKILIEEAFCVLNGRPPLCKRHG